MRTFLIVILILSSIVCEAQDPIPALITDRPDQTESSAIVPYRSLQIETGSLMEKNGTNLSEQKAFAYNTTLFRYGLLDNFELRLGMDYLRGKEHIKNTDTTYTFAGLSPVYTGFKVKIAEEEGWKPEIAFLGGMLFPFTAGEHFKLSHPAANMRFAFAHTLSDRFSLGYNLGAEWNGESAQPGFYYSVSLGTGISDYLGMFIESYGLVRGKGDAEHLLDAGVTFLLLPNLQLDMSGGIGIHDAADNFVNFGVSYRIPG
jgi:hypothetical protein